MVQGSGFRVQGSKFRVQGSRFEVQGSGFKVQGSGFKVQSSRFRVQGSRFKVRGSRFRVQGLRFEVQGSLVGSLRSGPIMRLTAVFRPSSKNIATMIIILWAVSIRCCLYLLISIGKTSGYVKRIIRIQ